MKEELEGAHKWSKCKNWGRYKEEEGTRMKRMESLSEGRRRSYRKGQWKAVGVAATILAEFQSRLRRAKDVNCMSSLYQSYRKYRGWKLSFPWFSWFQSRLEPVFRGTARIFSLLRVRPSVSNSVFKKVNLCTCNWNITWQVHGIFHGTDAKPSIKHSKGELSFIISRVERQIKNHFFS